MNEDLELMMSEIPANMTMDDVDTYLCHYGTSGMKWGRRLYQNLDGSLTPLGRLRYGVQYKNIKQVEAGRKAKAAKKEEQQERKKQKQALDRAKSMESIIRSGNATTIFNNQHLMTDDELRRAVDRVERVGKIRDTIEKEKNTPLNAKAERVAKIIDSGSKATTAIIKVLKEVEKSNK